MKKIKKFISLIAGITFLCFITFLEYASGDVFQWTDEQGQTHFTDKIHKVPKQFRQDAEEKKQYDMPPIIISEEPSQGDPDKKRKIVKKKRDKDFDEIKPRVDQGIPSVPIGIGFTGQQIDSDWIEVLNGGIKYIPTLGVRLMLYLLNKNEEPVWIKLKFEGERACKVGQKIHPGEAIIFSCRINRIPQIRAYPIRITLFNSKKAWEKFGSVKRYDPFETHTVKFKFNYSDIKRIDELMAKAKTNRLGNAFHGEIQSNWIEITSSTIRNLKRPLGQRYVLGLNLKNKTRKGVWVTVAFSIPYNPHKCVITKNISGHASESYKCIREGTLFLHEDYHISIVVYENEKDAKAAKYPKETIQTELRLGD